METLVNMCVLLAGACWGSFLNVIAVRGLSGLSLTQRSRCSTCNSILAWWQLIPIISWIALRGHCSSCQKPISAWYPIIEYLTALWLWSLWNTVPLQFFPALLILSSALIVTIRTDGEHFLILRWCTIGIIPVGLAAAACGYLPITFTQSILGALAGGCYLSLVRTLFLWWKNYEGLGEGDIELIAAIGAFLGPFGMLMTVLIASCLGTAYGLGRWMLNASTSVQAPIPFGVCLALGTWATLLTKML